MTQVTSQTLQQVETGTAEKTRLQTAARKLTVY